MFNVIKTYRVFLYLILCLAILAGCAVEPSKSLFDPEDTTGLTPEITSITPEAGALAGVGEVVINGSNFTSETGDVMVFFDYLQGVVREASPERIAVQAPNVYGDSIAVKVAVHKVERFSNTVYYSLLPAVESLGTLMDDDVGYGIAVDKAGNVYVSFDDKEIKKITPEGVTSTHVPSTTFLKAFNMKMGPNDVIYAAVAAGRVRKIATIQPDGTEGTYVTLPVTPRDLDFDQNGNLWVGAAEDVYIVKPDKTSEVVLSVQIMILSLRVFNDHLYIYGHDENSGEAKIWKAPIQGETLGDAELVLDVAGAGWLEGALVKCLSFTADGRMILGTNHAGDAMFVFDETDGSSEVLYPDLIAPDIYAISWDDGNYLYAVRQFDGEDGPASRILRLDMAQSGAPYLGRK